MTVQTCRQNLGWGRLAATPVGMGRQLWVGFCCVLICLSFFPNSSRKLPPTCLLRTLVTEFVVTVPGAADQSSGVRVDFKGLLTQLHTRAWGQNSLKGGCCPSLSAGEPTQGGRCSTPALRALWFSHWKFHTSEGPTTESGNYGRESRPDTFQFFFVDWRLLSPS